MFWDRLKDINILTKELWIKITKLENFLFMPVNLIGWTFLLLGWKKKKKKLDNWWAFCWSDQFINYTRHCFIHHNEFALIIVKWTLPHLLSCSTPPQIFSRLQFSRILIVERQRGGRRRRSCTHRGIRPFIEAPYTAENSKVEWDRNWKCSVYLACI